MRKLLRVMLTVSVLAGCTLMLGAIVLFVQPAQTRAGQTELPSADAITVIEGARLIDGTGHPATETSVLVIKGNRVSSVGPSAPVSVPRSARWINARGRTIIPGLINAHGHLGMAPYVEIGKNAYTRENIAAELAQYQAYGVTSMLSLGLNKDLVYDFRDEQRRGALPGATIFTAGRGIGVPNGAPPVAAGPDQLYRPAAPDEARAAVREMAAHHADIIKVWVDDFYGKYPKMRPEIYKAVIDEAHRQKLRVAAHVFYLADAKSLVSAGVDALAHSIRDKPVDPELIDRMKSHGVWYIPTLVVDESFFAFAEEPAVIRDPFFAGAMAADGRKQLDSDDYRKKVSSDPNLPKYKAALAMAMQNLKTLHDAGVHIAFGTDSGANSYRVPGWSEHRELELMTRAGLTPMDAIVAATRGSAAVLGASDRGTLEPGKRADFVILEKNPLDGITNTRQIESIWHDGQEIAPRVTATASK